MNNPERTPERMSDMNDRIADYINGHLAGAEKEQLEAALEADSNLHDELVFQTQLRESVRSEALNVAADELPMPSFESIRDQLQPKPTLQQKLVGFSDWVGELVGSDSWGKVAMPVACGFLLFGVLLALPQKDTEEFKTITDDPAVIVQQADLQITTLAEVDKSDLESLLIEYGLQAVQWHDELNSVDVTVPTGISTTELRERLALDARVRFTNPIEKP